jgi:hypothetical protein
MGTKLSPKALRLYRAVDEVLHYVWDPIGIAHVPEARDEYYSYLPQVFDMVRDARDEPAIASYLGKVRVDRMGLPARPDFDLAVARLLLEWKSYVDLDDEPGSEASGHADVG